MLRNSWAASAALILCVSATSQAAKVKVWHHHAPAHYDKAHLKQTVISSEGAVRLSRQLKPLAAVEATHVWDVVEDRNGNLFAATGNEGKLFKVAADGKVTVAYTSEDSQILCLALAADGTIYAGTGPGGRVLRLDAGGKVDVLCKTPETYVWSLAVSSDGKSVFAGTGAKGRIYAITPDGKARVFYTTKQEHILSLGMGADGLLYAGTDKNGLVYRIDPQGKGFVLFSAPQAEVRSLLVATDGVYAGTSSPTRRRNFASSSDGGSRNALSSGGGGSAVSVSNSKESAKTSTDEISASPSSGSSPSAGDSSERSTPASAASGPAGGENSLYRITADGTVREIFREKTLVLSLFRENGKIFIGTGMEGQLFEVDEATREHSEIARLDHGQIHCLYRRHDGSIVLGTGDPGRLYVLQDRYAARGTVTSEVLDAKLISKWGSLRWRADTPAGTAISVALRTGNTPEPDSTWSDWMPEQTDAQQASITAPAARFLQYRVMLTTEDAQKTPALHSIALRYMTTNQAPEVTSITVPDLDAANLDNPKKLRFKWSATDANEDELTYNLYVRKDGWKNWVLLEEDLEHTDFEWDTTTTPSGMYRLKVVASDRKDNPPEAALTGQRTSNSFAVAHEAPTVTLKTAGMDGDQAIIEATATDPLVRLTSASYSVNGKKWVNVFPTDGLFDSKTESFRFKTNALKPGTYVVVLRAKDAAGNTGSGDLVFTVSSKDKP
ncbi:MAG TPA: hypothetical protein VG013_29565 [Gemmataceae bacterium]|nr:hypothetical protein [Gemmataceae bacterium]